MTVYPEKQLRDILSPISNTVDVIDNEEYDVAGVYSFGRGLFRRPAISGTETNYRRFNRLGQGQIVYSKLFGWEGAIAYVTEDFDGAHVSHEFPTFAINTKKAEPRYVRHMITWPALHAALNKGASGMGSRRQRVSPERFLSTNIPLPNVAEQVRVANILDTTMSKIARVRDLRIHSDRTLRKLCSSVFTSISERTSLSSVLHQSYDLVSVQPDNTYVTAGILNRGRGLFRRPVISGSETKYTKYNRLHANQFVYSKLFGWEGSLAVVPDEFDGAYVSHEFPTFEIDSTIADIEYMTHLARWSGLHDALKDQGTGMGSRRQRVNVDRLLAAEVPMPSDLAEQRRIAQRLTLAHHSMEAGVAQTEQANVLQKSLLNAAFSGQL